MGATPNFDANTPNATPSGNSMSGMATGLRGDDVSFNHSGRDTSDLDGKSAEEGVDTAKRMVDTGLHKTQDAISQLQAKASELTARVIDNINVDDLTRKLEQQVRDHPARTLVLAMGAGFMLGKSLNKK